MGQYYKICNIDKKEYLYSHKFGDGSKLMEFGSSAYGVMNALAILLAHGNGLGGGDLDSDDPVIGRWAGDRIVISGDYANNKFVQKEDLKGIIDYKGNPMKKEDCNLYILSAAKYKDISYDALYALLDDQSVRQYYKPHEEDGKKYPGRVNLHDYKKVVEDMILIKETCEEDLPTLIQSMQTDEGKGFLERELKNE